MVEGLKSGVLDVAFLDGSSRRAQADVNFSPADLEIQATYLVRAGSPLRHWLATWIARESASPLRRRAPTSST